MTFSPLFTLQCKWQPLVPPGSEISRDLESDHSGAESWHSGFRQITSLWLDFLACQTGPIVSTPRGSCEFITLRCYALTDGMGSTGQGSPVPTCFHHPRPRSMAVTVDPQKTTRGAVCAWRLQRALRNGRPNSERCMQLQTLDGLEELGLGPWEDLRRDQILTALSPVSTVNGEG